MTKEYDLDNSQLEAGKWYESVYRNRWFAVGRDETPQANMIGFKGGQGLPSSMDVAMYRLLDGCDAWGWKEPVAEKPAKRERKQLYAGKQVGDGLHLLLVGTHEQSICDANSIDFESIIELDPEEIGLEPLAEVVELTDDREEWIESCRRLLHYIDLYVNSGDPRTIQIREMDSIRERIQALNPKP